MQRSDCVSATSGPICRSCAPVLFSPSSTPFPLCVTYQIIMRHDVLSLPSTTYTLPQNVRGTSTKTNNYYYYYYHYYYYYYYCYHCYCYYYYYYSYHYY